MVKSSSYEPKYSTSVVRLISVFAMLSSVLLSQIPSKIEIIRNRLDAYTQQQQQQQSARVLDPF
jgi:hypothetical protein